MGSLRHTVLGQQRKIEELELKVQKLKLNLINCKAALEGLRPLVQPERWGNSLDAILRHAADALSEPPHDKYAGKPDHEAAGWRPK